MPRYFQDTPAPARDGFKSFDEITHFLTKVPHNEWRQFQSVAHSYLNGTQVPKRKLKKSALYKIVTAERGHHLLPELHGELQSYYDQEDVGGGITETLSTLGSAVGHRLVSEDPWNHTVFEGAPDSAFGTDRVAHKTNLHTA